jgi:hypothetical protein
MCYIHCCAAALESAAKGCLPKQPAPAKLLRRRSPALAKMQVLLLLSLLHASARQLLLHASVT